jgi:hypothetical protein
MSSRRRLILPLLLLAILALPAAANAMAPAQLWQTPEVPVRGSGAGQMKFPEEVAVSPLTGNLFVADRLNERIDEFTPWGEFVEAFGWKVNASDPAEELQVCTAATGCQAGSEGSGPGQFKSFKGLAIDSAGDIYVADLGNHRVQKFDPEGNFLLMFGGDVNKTTGGNICTAASGNECGAGVTGTEPGEFSTWDVREPEWSAVNAFDTFSPLLAVGPGDRVYVGDRNRIQIFNSDGIYQEAVSLPAEGEVEHGQPEGKAQTGALAVDSAGNILFTFPLVEPISGPLSGHRLYPGIFKHTSSGWSLFNSDETPLSLATNSAGDVSVVDTAKIYNGAYGYPRIVEFDPAGNTLIPTKEEEEANKRTAEEYESFHGFFGQRPPFEINGIASGNSACGISNAFYASYDETFTGSFLVAYGETPDPALCPPPRNSPSITEQFATAAGSREAILQAKVNSRFWTTTTYHVEYGTESCDLGGCRSTEPLKLNSKVNAPVPTKGAFLSDLQPGTTYHYRFVASTCFETKSGGEECETGQEVLVRGAGGTPGTDGTEAEFTTSEGTLPPKEVCANQAFRTGPAAPLPDCRAYEMVSPVEKEGADIVTLINVTGFPARLDQSATSGEKLTYSAFRPFDGSAAGNTSSQYIAIREEGRSWSTRPISPPIGRSLLAPGANVEREYGLFSEDLCQGWLRSNYKAEPVLDPAAVPDFPDLYRARLCGGGGYEAISTLAPPHADPESYAPLQIRGVSADGSVALYSANDNLTPEAPELQSPQSEVQVYVRAADGTTRYVCFLPSGVAATQCGTGAGNKEGGEPRFTQVYGAISADGSKVYFTAAGRLYLRENPTQPQSAVAGGRCTEEGMGCTIAIPDAATYWAASPDGNRVLFATTAASLREYDVEEGTTTTIAGSGLVGVLGQSTDLSRVYFVSTAKLASGATTGQKNLYFYEAGVGTRYITELGAADVIPGALAAVTLEPIRRASRVSPDGLTAAFVSTSALTGYDNTDAKTGEADEEVFLYEAQANEGEGELHCVSCDPAGARPTGATLTEKPWEGVHTAAWIPTWETALYPSRTLSADGTKLFFNSLVPLVPRDTDGRQDVYEWEAGESKAACEAQGAERYTASAGGCISLISSGESSLASEFLDASPSGRDIFFTTASSLVPQDPGLIDVYDAREGGGLPVPAGPPAACEGEACQSPPAPPNDPTPASSSFEGAGNVSEAKAKSSKPKHKKKNAKKNSKKKSAKKHKKNNKHGRKH